MIYFIEGRDDEINASFDELRNAVSRRVGGTLSVCLTQTDIGKSSGYVVAEISDVQRCIDSGISADRIVGIGYSHSSYYGKPTVDGLHRHYTTSKMYNPAAVEIPFGYTHLAAIQPLSCPKIIGIVSDFIPPHLGDLEEYSYVHTPKDDEHFDVLVYASHNDRYSRLIRRAVSCGKPIIGYTSVPLISDLVKHGLAFELKECDDFENVVTNTMWYIASNIPWQLNNSISMFTYARDYMNWDCWSYELEHLQ